MYGRGNKIAVLAHIIDGAVFGAADDRVASMWHGELFLDKCLQV